METVESLAAFFTKSEWVKLDGFNSRGSKTHDRNVAEMAKYINRSSVYNQMNIKLTRQVKLQMHLENIKTDLVRKTTCSLYLWHNFTK